MEKIRKLKLFVYFYPRSPCGERRLYKQTNGGTYHISIHALLAESDRLSNYCERSGMLISIHALLAESD